MKKEKHRHKEAVSSQKHVTAINALLLIQLILMLTLSIGITQLISISTSGMSDKYMTTIADERSRIIRNYVESAENILASYSHAGEVRRVLENPSDTEAVAAVQKYTEEFSKDIKNLEGIYVSEWNTHVIAHTDPMTVGITTRTGDSLKALQNALSDAGNEVYDTGIIASPATGRQIVSMYRAVYGQDGNPVGIAGLGIYTDGLVDVLDTLSSHDMGRSFYSMIDIKDRRYIFHPEENRISSEANISPLLALCSSLEGSSEDRCGKFTYKVQNTEYVSMYSYISDMGWLFMIDDTASEVYSLTRNMRGYLVLFCIFCFILIVMFNIINKKRQDTAEHLTTVVEKHERTRESLSNAVYNDFLTDIRNRISFSSDFEEGKITVPEKAAYYFALFNIRNFSKVNILFGEEAGDMILVTSARLLNQNFPGAQVYRTGSDEFVVAQLLPEGKSGYDQFMESINQTMNNFSRPFEAGDDRINVTYSVSAAFKSKDVNISVLPALKNIMNMSVQQGPVIITDLDIANI